MKIQIHPTAALPGHQNDTALVSGETITHNGQAFDLAVVPEGGIATPEGDHPFVGLITREGGKLSLALRMAYDTATAEPNQPTAQGYWVVDVEDGPIPDLVVRRAAK